MFRYAVNVPTHTTKHITVAPPLTSIGGIVGEHLYHESPFLSAPFQPGKNIKNNKTAPMLLQDCCSLNRGFRTGCTATGRTLQPLPDVPVPNNMGDSGLEGRSQEFTDISSTLKSTSGMRSFNALSCHIQPRLRSQ
jgi:hypothetical protein